MAAFEEVFNAAFDLLDANAAFQHLVSKHDFSKIADTGSTAVVLRVGGFTSQDESFGGTYSVVWTIFADIYERYGAHVEEDIENLIKSRDILMDLLQQKTYLGKGASNAIGIEFVNVIGGDTLGVVFDDEGVATHFTLSVQFTVAQQRSVTLEA